jgi:CheY-like chemotaxis protein
MVSSPGAGSEFWVELGFGLASPEATALLEAIATAPGTRALRGQRILVVDDSDINLDVTRHILELEGAEVLLAMDGKGALDLLRSGRHTINVVLMDVHMPGLDGRETTERIRHELKLTRVPIIALTADALSSERQRAAAAGMDDYIIKPFDPPTLIRTILRHIRTPGAREPGPAAPVPSVPVLLSWPEIDGIDSRETQARFGGDLRMFLSLLTRLLSQYSDLALPLALHDRAVRAAHKARMHKLRGSAGMVGATSIQLLAAETEAACARGDAAGALQHTSGLAVLVQRLVDCTGPLFLAEKLREEQSRIGASAWAPDGAVARERMAELIALLGTQTLSAVDRYEAITPQLRSLLGEAAFAVVGDHMDNLRFTEAARILVGSQREEPGLEFP